MHYFVDKNNTGRDLITNYELRITNYELRITVLVLEFFSRNTIFKYFKIERIFFRVRTKILKS